MTEDRIKGLTLDDQIKSIIVASDLQGSLEPILRIRDLARAEGWNAAVEACVAIAESAINSRQSAMNPTYGVGINDAAKSISASIRALSVAKAECQHVWADARNDLIKSGEFCTICYAIRGGNTTKVEAAKAE